MIKFMKGGANTKDATAVANDIKKGKTAYTADGKVTGTFENKLNIFLQEEEPDTKEGLWLQNGNLTYDTIIMDDNIIAQEDWDTVHQYPSIPSEYDARCNRSVSVGTDIYLLGYYSYSTMSTNPTFSKCNYKFDTLTNTFTKMTDIPFLFGRGGAVAIGTDIYLLGGLGDRKAYKYDTLNDSYEQLTAIPSGMYIVGGGAAAVGTDIYLFSGNNNSDYKVCKYDTLLNEYTQLADSPISINNLGNGDVIAVGTNIYLFNRYKGYKYDTLTQKYTEITDASDKICDGALVSVGTNIYIFSGDKGVYACYKFDILSDTFSKLPDMPFAFKYGSAACVGDNIYLLGGGNGFHDNKVDVMNLTIKDYTNNSIVISQGGYDKKTQLVGHIDVTGRLTQYFRDAWHYTTEDKLNKNIPTYYGDGEKWVKFKN